MIWPSFVVHAATVNWANAGTDFTLGANWTGGLPPADNLTGDIAAFASATPTFQPNLAVNRSVAGVAFVNAAGSFTFSGAGTLSLGASGIVNGDNSTQTLSVPLRLGLNTAFSTNSTGALAISGTVDTNGLALTLNGNGSGASAISGIIGGTGSLTKSGTGIWTLSGANIFSGGVTLGAGTLALGHNTALGTGTFTVNGGTISATAARIVANAVNLGGNAIIGGAQTITFQAPINLTGDRTLTVNNTALTTLAGGVTETGGARSFAKAGTGSLLVQSSLGNSGNLILSAGTLLLDTGVSLSSGNFSMTGGTLGASGVISRTVGTGAGQIQFGAGALTFVAYNGPLSLSFGGGEIWGSTPGFLQNSTLTLNSTLATGVVTLASNFSLGAATRTISVADNTLSLTDSAAITGSLDGAGGLTKTGTGLLALSGTNTYLGATTLTTGTLRAQGAASLGAGSLALNGGLLQLAGDINTTFGRDTTLGAATTITVDRVTAGPGVTHTLGTLSTGTFALTVSPGTGNNANTAYGLTFGAATLAGNPTFTVNRNGLGDGTLTLGALADGGAARTLIKAGTGTLVLSAPAAAWTTPGNALRVNNGTVRATASGVLGSATDVTLNATAANTTALLDLNGNSLTVASVTFGGGGATTSTNNLSTGLGTLTLNGDLTFVATGNPLGSTLSGNLALTTAHIFNIGNSTNAANDLTISALTSGSGGFTKTGAGTLALSGLNTYLGQTQIQAGTVSINSLGNVAGGPSALGNPQDALTGKIALGSGANAAILVHTGPATASDRAFDLAGTTGGATLTANGTGALNLSGAVTASGSGAKAFTLTGTNAGANTLSGAISDSDGGSTSLVKNGAGNWILEGLSSYSGQTQILAGTLRINSLGSLGAGPSALGNPATIPAGTITLGSLTNVVGLDYTGGATMSNRTLDLAGTTGAITINASGTGALSFTGGVTASGAGSKTLTLTGTNLSENELGGIVVDNSLANKTSISKTGAGTWKLSGANTYTGTTTFALGTLIAANDTAFGGGTLSITGAGTLRGDGTSRVLANNISLGVTGATIGGSSALTFNGTLTNTLSGSPTLNVTNSATTTFTTLNLSNSATSRTVTFNVTGDVLITGIIANGGTSTASALTKTGAGKLTLSGPNTYAGATTLTAGTLRATTNASALGAGALSLGAGTLELANDTNLAFNRNTTLTAASTIKIDRLTAGAGVTHTLGNLTTATFALNVQPGALLDPNTPYGLTFGAVTLTGAPFTLNVTNNGSAAGTVTLGALSSAAANGLTLSGPGTVFLNATSGSIFSATPFVINRGTLRLGASNAIGASALANVTVNATTAGETALLDLNGNSQSILSLTLGGAGATSTSTNNVATGAGTLTLGGNVSFTNTNNPLGSTISGNLSLGSANRTFTVGDSSNATIDLLVSAAITGTGGLIKAGTGRLDLTGANSYSGPTTLGGGGILRASSLGSGALSLGAGTLELAGDSNLGFGNSTTIAAATTIRVDRVTAGAGVTHALGNLTTGTFALNVQPGSLVTANTTYGLTFGAVTLTGAPLILNVANNGAAAGTVTLGALSSSAANGLTLTGPGTVVLNSASGSLFSTTPFLINRGTLRLAASNALGATAVANVTVSSNLAGATALLDLDGNSQSILSLTLGGATATSTSTNNVSTGAGTLTLGGNVTFTSTNNPLGSTISGNLSLGAATRTFTINDSTNAATDLDVSAVVSGSVGLVKAGAGALRLSGTNLHSGGTTLSAGTLIAASAGALGSGTLTLTAGTIRGDGSALILPNNVDVTASGPIIGGTSALTFNGTLTNTFAGNPVLNFTNTGGTTFNNVNLSNSATSRTLTFTTTGDVSITGVIANGGTSTAGALTKTGAGKLTLSGTNTYTGATTLSAGTLRAAGNAAALGAGSLSLGGGILELAGDTGLAFNRNTTLTAASTIKIDRLTAGPGVIHTLGNLTTATFALNVQPGALLDPNTSYGLTFGAVSLVGNPLTLNVANNGSATGTVTLGALSSSAARGLTLNGPGTIVLGSASGSISSGTSVVINAGTLRFGASNALGAGAVTNVTINDLTGATAQADLANFSQTVLALNFGGAGATAQSTNNVSTGSGTLTLGGNVTFNATNNPLASTIAGVLSLGTSTRTFTVADSSNATTDLLVTAAVTGTGGLIKAGAGRLDLMGSNTYAGTTTLSAGTLGIGSNSALGSGSVTLTSGTVIAVGASRTLANNLSFSTGASIAFAGANLIFNGTVALAGTDTLTNSTNVTFGGTVSGTGALVHNGAGTLILSAPNTYSGGTNVSGGTLRASNIGVTSATGSGAISVGPSGTLAGAGRVTGGLTLNGTISPGGPAGSGPGVLSTGNEIWNSGAHYVWELSSATGTAGVAWDKLALSGNLTIAATSASRFVIDIYSLTTGNVPGPAANFSNSSNYSWIIATVTGSVSDFASDKFTVTDAYFTNPHTGTFAVSVSGNNLLLNYTAAVPEPSAWGAALGLGCLVSLLARRRRS